MFSILIGQNISPHIFKSVQMLQAGGGLIRSSSTGAGAGAGASSSSSFTGVRPAPLATKRQSNALSASMASGPASSGPLGLRATRQRDLDAEDVTDSDEGVEIRKQKKMKCDDRARSRALLKLLRVMDVKVCAVLLFIYVACLCVHHSQQFQNGPGMGCVVTF
jgi:hypothetical protein